MPVPFSVYESLCFLKCCQGALSNFVCCSVVCYLFAHLLTCLCSLMMFLKCMHDSHGAIIFAVESWPVVRISYRRTTAVVQRHAPTAAVQAR